MPAKANPVEQKKFIDETLLPIIDQAKSGSVELFFMDASHFVMGGFPGRVWSLVRRFVKTSSGRKRYNVLGALNFVTGCMETVCNNTYITATQVVEMLEMLATKCHLPIHIVLDNVPYQKCQLVKDAAKRLSIELHYLPTYSPNLNLIERVWKFVKGRVLNSAYFETFDVFCENIMGCVNNLHTIHRADMQRLITPKFHIIDDKLIITGKRLGG